jgi:hypothetical protein
VTPVLCLWNNGDAWAKWHEFMVAFEERFLLLDIEDALQKEMRQSTQGNRISGRLYLGSPDSVPQVIKPYNRRASASTINKEFEA